MNLVVPFHFFSSITNVNKKKHSLTSRFFRTLSGPNVLENAASYKIPFALHIKLIVNHNFFSSKTCRDFKLSAEVFPCISPLFLLKTEVAWFQERLSQSDSCTGRHNLVAHLAVYISATR